jgi:hypothetical protein
MRKAKQDETRRDELVVLTPTSELYERAGSCPACGSIGLRSQVPERSHFTRAGTGTNLRYARYCRSCQDDPDRVEEFENAQIDAWEAREAAGESLPFRPQSKQLQVGVPFPLPAFQEWLRMLAREEARFRPENPTVAVAHRLGVSPRRIREWSSGRAGIDEATVDRLVTYDGTITAEEIRCYAESPSQQQAEIIRPCANPDCGNPREVGRFCGSCSARLAAIRVEFQGESKAMAAMGGATRAESRRNPHRSKVPSCCNPHCWAPREIGERFCPDCLDLGYVEEEMFQ